MSKRVYFPIKLYWLRCSESEKVGAAVSIIADKGNLQKAFFREKSEMHGWMGSQSPKLCFNGIFWPLKGYLFLVFRDIFIYKKCKKSAKSAKIQIKYDMYQFGQPIKLKATTTFKCRAGGEVLPKCS